MADCVQRGPNPDDRRFRIARTALESGRIAAINEGIEEQTEVLVIVQIGDEDGASLSMLGSEDHLGMMSRALQSFADLSGAPIQVMYVDPKGGEGNPG